MTFSGSKNVIYINKEWKINNWNKITEYQRFCSSVSILVRDKFTQNLKLTPRTIPQYNVMLI